MAIEEKKISYRMYFVAVMFFIMAVFVLVKLNNIQWVDGTYYRELAKERTVKNFTIPANKGNVYASDGSLLATSIPEYAIYFDAVVSSDEHFKENIKSSKLLVNMLFSMIRGSYHWPAFNNFKALLFP